MSGGVDSSVAAALLVRAGYDVVGCFMRLGTPGETLDQLTPADRSCPSQHASPHAPHSVRIGRQGCCSITDAADARLVAAELGIPLYICNFKKDFGRIIDYFVDEYAAGRTPNPCVRCNDWLKFGKLSDYAGQVGAAFIASGHYARVETTGGDPRLLRAIDHAKDQSYVLFGVPRGHLGRMLLPIGGYEKPAVRDLARRFGLPTFDKPDSQEICFVPDNDYAGLVESRRAGLASPGRIVDRAGRELGAHGGQHRFTVGQRRGLGIAADRPLYVLDKNPATNTVTVGDKEDLLAAGCLASEANWLIDPPVAGEAWTPCAAKVRSNAPPAPAAFRVTGDSSDPTPSGRTGTFEVRFEDPQSAVAPGQAVVLYGRDEPDRVLGGGWTSRAV
jgi:tRNA-specific 2-thiouridylase